MRRDVQEEVRAVLAGEEREVLMVLPAFAGEVLADDDASEIAALKDELGAQLIGDHAHSEVLEATLAFVRTYGLKKQMRRVAPGSAPRRSNDPKL